MSDIRENTDYKLFLDDMRFPSVIWWEEAFPNAGPWIIARSYDEFVKCITERGLPKAISFDHDLSEEHYSESMYESQEAYEEVAKTFKEKTGYECAQYILNLLKEQEISPYAIPMFVHSFNPVGKKRIQDLIIKTRLEYKTDENNS